MGCPFWFIVKTFFRPTFDLPSFLVLIEEVLEVTPFRPENDLKGSTRSIRPGEARGDSTTDDRSNNETRSRSRVVRPRPRRMKKEKIIDRKVSEHSFK